MDEAKSRPDHLVSALFTIKYDINSLQTGEVDVSLDSIAHPRAILW